MLIKILGFQGGSLFKDGQLIRYVAFIQREKPSNIIIGNGLG